MTPEKKPTSLPTGKEVGKRQRPANVFTGILFSLNETNLVMTNKKGKSKSLTFSKNLKSSCNGIPCETKDLKTGRKIRVTTQESDHNVAMVVRSIDNKSGFAPSR